MRAFLRHGLLGILALVALLVLVMVTAACFALRAAAVLPASAFNRFTHSDAVAAAFDRFGYPLAIAVVKRFGLAARPAHVRAIVSLMAANELRADWDGVSPVIGDLEYAVGPSV